MPALGIYIARCKQYKEIFKLKCFDLSSLETQKGCTIELFQLSLANPK